jgi:DNA-binding XRE family transcriptional regulator/molybdate-binding protein
LACGLTQGALAERAGVSRQLVAAVETGRHAPAVDAALGLARALGTSVEELFAAPGSEVVSALGGRLRDRAPVQVGRVGDQLVAAELPDHGIAGAGWAKPDGSSHRGRVELFPGAAPAGVVLAGCDPAFGVAERMLDGLGSRSLMAVSASTGAALHALGRGTVHVAVVHGVDSELPDPPVSVIRWHVARWQVGLGVARSVRGRSLEALLATGVPVVRRDDAAASQRAFDRALRAAGVDRTPPGPIAAGHLDAARIATTLGGAAVTTEAAARAFDLRFLPIEDHIVELWAAERWCENPGVDALVDLLTTSAFTARVAQYGGYDLTDCGELVTST